MQLGIVILGLNGPGTHCGLVQELRRRGHCITHLRHATPATAGWGRGAETAAACGLEAETLFKQHTGTVRTADMIIVGSDVPEHDTVVNWVLDQATGVVVYYDAKAATRLEPAMPVNRGPGANFGVPLCDLYVAGNAWGGASGCAVALERYVGSHALAS